MIFFVQFQYWHLSDSAGMFGVQSREAVKDHSKWTLDANWCGRELFDHAPILQSENGANQYIDELRSF